jgi:hypothetical protein
MTTRSRIESESRCSWRRKTWRFQRGQCRFELSTGLPPFEVPGKKEFADLEAEKSFMPPAAFATQDGRASFKRVRRAIAISTKPPKHAKDSAE